MCIKSVFKTTFFYSYWFTVNKMSKFSQIWLCAKIHFDLRWNMADVSPRVFCKGTISYKVNLLVSHSTKDKQVLYILKAMIVANHNLRPACVWSRLIACFVTGNWQNCFPSCLLFCLWHIRDVLVWAVLRLCPEYQITWSFPVFFCLTDEDLFHVFSLFSLCEAEDLSNTWWNGKVMYV